MGVTQLWQILSPVQQHRSLSSLAGQTLAVDLSIWVCETQSVKQMQGVVSKPFLRNLFFRVSHLTQLGVKLVFVIEGTAPELKWEAMMQRQQARFPRKQGQDIKPSRKQTRRNFNTCIKECCELLDILGVPYIQSAGEAEAMCAVLSAAGIVDGCLTNDGDAFLYGARVVYRNFTMNSKDPHVERYCMSDIETQLRIDRNGMVGLALLLGCDYLPKGVPGIGVANAVKLLQSLQGRDVLARFQQWRQLADTDCVDSTERLMRRKAISSQGFPHVKVIREFIEAKDKCPSSIPTWRRPRLEKFQEFSLAKLEWPIEYSLEKILPLVTRWDMLDVLEPSLHKSRRNSSCCLEPHRIVKVRVRQGVPCYEVDWIKPDTDQWSAGEHYVTIEEQEMFGQCYPGLVQQLQLELAKKPVRKKGKSKQTNATSVSGEEAASKAELPNVNSSEIGCHKGPADSVDTISQMSQALCNLQLEEEIQPHSDSCSTNVASSQGQTVDWLDGKAKPTAEVNDVCDSEDPVFLEICSASCHGNGNDSDKEEYAPLSERLKQRLNPCARKGYVSTSEVRLASQVEAVSSNSTSLPEDQAMVKSLDDQCVVESRTEAVARRTTGELLVLKRGKHQTTDIPSPSMAPAECVPVSRDIPEVKYCEIVDSPVRKECVATPSHLCNDTTPLVLESSLDLAHHKMSSPSAESFCSPVTYIRHCGLSQTADGENGHHESPIPHLDGSLLQCHQETMQESFMHVNDSTPAPNGTEFLSVKSRIRNGESTPLDVREILRKPHLLCSSGLVANSSSTSLVQFGEFEVQTSLLRSLCTSHNQTASPVQLEGVNIRHNPISTSPDQHQTGTMIHDLTGASPVQLKNDKYCHFSEEPIECPSTSQQQGMQVLDYDKHDSGPECQKQDLFENHSIPNSYMYTSNQSKPSHISSIAHTSQQHVDTPGIAVTMEPEGLSEVDGANMSCPEHAVIVSKKYEDSHMPVRQDSKLVQLTRLQKGKIKTKKCDMKQSAKGQGNVPKAKKVRQVSAAMDFSLDDSGSFVTDGDAVGVSPATNQALSSQGGDRYRTHTDVLLDVPLHGSTSDCAQTGAGRNETITAGMTPVTDILQEKGIPDSATCASRENQDNYLLLGDDPVCGEYTDIDKGIHCRRTLESVDRISAGMTSGRDANSVQSETDNGTCNSVPSESISTSGDDSVVCIDSIETTPRTATASVVLVTSTCTSDQILNNSGKDMKTKTLAVVDKAVLNECVESAHLIPADTCTVDRANPIQNRKTQDKSLLKTTLNGTVDSKPSASPVCLADRLRSRLKNTSTKSVLCDIKGPGNTQIHVQTS